MWRKQSEGKPSSSAPGSSDSQPYATPSTFSSVPTSSSPSGASLSSSPISTAETSLLTRGIRIKGDLTGKGELTVDGEVTGSIRLGDSRVAVGPNGRVKANIDARDVAVRGQVEGNLHGRERVLLGSTGNVIGDIEAARVVIEDGAQFKGRVEIGRAPEPRADREMPKKPAPSMQASAPAAMPTRPAATPAAVPAVPAQTASTGPSSSSTPASTLEKGPAVPPAPAGVPGGSR